MVCYGIVLGGPPGSGKTTAAVGIQEYLRLLGRNAWVVNLDPANEVPPGARQRSTRNENQSGDSDAGGGGGSRSGDGMSNNSSPSNSSREVHSHVTQGSSNDLPYETILDVCDSVVNLSEVMMQTGLGPNGGLVYCLEYMEAHADDIIQLLKERLPADAYLIFDLPGQVEIYSHNDSIPNLLHTLSKQLDLRLVVVQLIDAHYCTEAATFLSASLLATTTMLRLELPTVSVLSKVDLLGNYGPLPFSLEYFTDCADLDRLLPFVSQGGLTNSDNSSEHNWGSRSNSISGSDNNKLRADVVDEFDYVDDPDYQKARRRTRQSPFFRKHQKLHQVLAETVDDFGLLSFLPLDISNAESVGRVIARIDKANGYVFTGKGSTPAQDMFQCAVQAEGSSSNYETIADIQERLSLSKEQHTHGTMM